MFDLIKCPHCEECSEITEVCDEFEEDKFICTECEKAFIYSYKIEFHFETKKIEELS